MAKLDYQLELESEQKKLEETTEQLRQLHLKMGMKNIIALHACNMKIWGSISSDSPCVVATESIIPLRSSAIPSR